MAHHSIGDVGDGHLGSWATPVGGMGAVAAALESSARSFGAEIRTEAPVERILTSSGAVRGVVLACGEEVAAPIVVAATHPKITFLRQLDDGELPDGLRRGHPELEVAERHGEDQPRARPRASVHRGPRARAI